MSEKTIKSLNEFEIIVPAKDLLNAIVVSADAYSKEPMNEERAKNMKLVLGFLNAYLKAFSTRVGYFKLTAVPQKLDIVKRHSKKL